MVTDLHKTLNSLFNSLSVLILFNRDQQVTQNFSFYYHSVKKAFIILSELLMKRYASLTVQVCLCFLPFGTLKSFCPFHGKLGHL